MELWFEFAKFQSSIAYMSRMKPDRDFKIAVMYLFGIPGIGVSRHGNDIRKT